jgi:hypothetical protein
MKYIFLKFINTNTSYRCFLIYYFPGSEKENWSLSSMMAEAVEQDYIGSKKTLALYNDIVETSIVATSL